MNKKRKFKKGFKVLILIIFIIIIGSVIFSIIPHSKIENKVKTTIKKNTKREENKTNNKEHFELSLIAVGDYLIHSSVYKYANKLANYNGYDFKPIFSDIKNIVKNYDLAYYNQETILGGTELGLSDYPVFNSPYEAGDDMLDAGFNLISLATNHTMDRGAAAVLNSCKYWEQKQDVLAVGSYCSESDRNKVQIREKNNIKYTMLNYAYGTNGMPRIEDYYINIWPTDLTINDPKRDTKYQDYKEQVKKDIESVKDKVDIIIVAMHWGVEYTHEPTAYEVDMAEYLSSLGVNIIIGTHPHVIQPVTWINDTLVIYSLGNFLSAQYQNQSVCPNYKCTVELMTNLKIQKDVENGNTTIKITDVENELIYNYYNQSTWSDFKVIPFSSEEIAKYLPSYKSLYETYKNIVKDGDDSIYVKDLYNE